MGKIEFNFVGISMETGIRPTIWLGKFSKMERFYMVLQNEPNMPMYNVVRLDGGFKFADDEMISLQYLLTVLHIHACTWLWYDMFFAEIL